MTWQGALLVCCLVLMAFGLGCWLGQRSRHPHIPWYRNSHDSRDWQSAWERRWRTR